MTQPGTPAAAPLSLIVHPPLCQRHLAHVVRGRNVLQSSAILGRLHTYLLQIISRQLDIPTERARTEWETTVLQWAMANKAPLCCYIGEARFAQLHLLVLLDLTHCTTVQN